MDDLCIGDVFDNMAGRFFVSHYGTIPTNSLFTSLTEKKFWFTVFMTSAPSMLPGIFGHSLHSVNINVSLQSIYSTHWELCKVVAVGAWNKTWVVLPLWKFGKAMRTECMVAWQELGFMVFIIIRLSTDATSQKFIWVGNACSALRWNRIQRCHTFSTAYNMKKCFAQMWKLRKRWRATAYCGKSKFAISSGWLKSGSVCHPDDMITSS